MQVCTISSVSTAIFHQHVLTASQILVDFHLITNKMIKNTKKLFSNCNLTWLKLYTCLSGVINPFYVH